MITIGICIPSYQRGLITRESILHIYTNNKKVFDEGLCHFYISDDCSRDDTFKILSNLNEEIKGKIKINILIGSFFEINLVVKKNNGDKKIGTNKELKSFCKII